MAMTPIPPITNAAVGSTVAQRVQSEHKDAHLRNAQVRRTNTPTGDSYEPQVRSPDELSPASEEHHKRDPKKQNKPKRGKPDSGDDDGQNEHVLDIKG